MTDEVLCSSWSFDVEGEHLQFSVSFSRWNLVFHGDFWEFFRSFCIEWKFLEKANQIDQTLRGQWITKSIRHFYVPCLHGTVCSVIMSWVSFLLTTVHIEGSSSVTTSCSLLLEFLIFVGSLLLVTGLQSEWPRNLRQRAGNWSILCSGRVNANLCVYYASKSSST